MIRCESLPRSPRYEVRRLLPHRDREFPQPSLFQESEFPEPSLPSWSRPRSRALSLTMTDLLPGCIRCFSVVIQIFCSAIAVLNGPRAPSISTFFSSFARKFQVPLRTHTRRNVVEQGGDQAPKGAFLISSVCRRVVTRRHPQFISYPTPPGEMTPPFKSKAATPPMGKP